MDKESNGLDDEDEDVSRNCDDEGDDGQDDDGHCHLGEHGQGVGDGKGLPEKNAAILAFAQKCVERIEGGDQHHRDAEEDGDRSKGYERDSREIKVLLAELEQNWVGEANGGYESSNH